MTDASRSSRSAATAGPVPRLSPLHGLLLLGVLGGVFEAARQAWICDDIFISLRYITHLFQGDGLVFNAGERVEGYTHFLWVMLLATLHRLGFDLVWLARYLSIVAFALLLVTLWWRAAHWRTVGLVGLPLAALAVAFHKDMQIYASGGLETMAFALCLLWAVLSTAGDHRRRALGAVLYALATLLRPEGALYAAAAAAFVAVESRSLRPALRFGGLYLLLMLPSQIFRVLYFGAWLPNTYFAKSGGGANWQQGWIYTSLYFEVYLVLLLCLVAILGAIAWALRSGWPRQASETSTPPTTWSVSLLASSHVVLSLLYVTRLGGDFMFARFFIPVTPLMLLVLEECVQRLRRRSVEWMMLAVLLAGMFWARSVHESRLPGRERVEGIVNEYNYYPQDYIDIARRQGEVMGRILQGTDAGVGLLSGQNAVAYFGNLRYALEPHGLTDAVLARKPITERGRPGHERTASLEDMLLREVHFRMRYAFTVGLRVEKQIRFDDLYGEIVSYDNAIMDQLRGRPGVSFLDYPDLLRATIDDLQGSDGQLVEDYRQAHLFYFMHNDDATLLAEYRQALQARGIPPSALDEVDQRAADFRRRMQAGGLRPRSDRQP